MVQKERPQRRRLHAGSSKQRSPSLPCAQVRYTRAKSQLEAISVLASVILMLLSYRGFGVRGFRPSVLGAGIWCEVLVFRSSPEKMTAGCCLCTGFRDIADIRYCSSVLAVQGYVSTSPAPPHDEPLFQICPSHRRSYPQTRMQCFHGSCCFLPKLPDVLNQRRKVPNPKPCIDG